MKSTIDKLIEDLTAIKDGKEPSIGFQLHNGIRSIEVGFGSWESAIEFFEKYRDTREEV
jgi:hypothetical protein